MKKEKNIIMKGICRNIWLAAQYTMSWKQDLHHAENVEEKKENFILPDSESYSSTRKRISYKKSLRNRYVSDINEW